ncbi:pyruvoyl-dependent arginine decarboxylase [Dethiosulfatarculus sandiegensis]|uniref:Pyruvoyl-dependent arginine decarboxylase AaxB n=1 Tax=Dethiosulfatarculus sandiegensis TaxID=1429043 RepID=A0A0D2J7G7_9BACT|nr:pyruvoyl-dependent arginine decarboxylase [Dethiosulfatarculus sandiegensis]KIX14154.1 pyruvoyl-dependent arginine decarboxylase [Dethiosulfatarculus sandiegensis]
MSFKYRFALALCLVITFLAAGQVLADEAVFGPRIPQDYFVTTGAGQTDLGSGIDPWETGAYDLALLQAGIENFNIVTYTSVLPPEAREIPLAQAKKNFHHGAVLETIMAAINGRQGDTLTAGVGRIQVRRKSDGKHIGGFAAEYRGHGSKEAAAKILEQSLKGIFDRRYDPAEYETYDQKLNLVSFVVKKKWGTALAAIGFVSYIFPRVK